MSSQITELPSPEAQSASSNKIGNNNALTHGGTSQKLILPGENPDDFKSLLTGLQSDYQPETEQQQLFIEQLALGHWFLWRHQRIYNAIEASVYAAAYNDPDCLNENSFRRFALVERYRTAAERALKRAFQNAESIRKDRQGQRDRLEHQSRWRAEQDLRESRQKLQEERQKAATARAALAAARAKANAEPEYTPLRWPKYVPGTEEWKKEKLAEAEKARQLADPANGQ